MPTSDFRATIHGRLRIDKDLQAWVAARGFCTRKLLSIREWDGFFYIVEDTISLTEGLQWLDVYDITDYIDDIATIQDARVGVDDLYAIVEYPEEGHHATVRRDGGMLFLTDIAGRLPIYLAPVKIETSQDRRREWERLSRDDD